MKELLTLGALLFVVKSVSAQTGTDSIDTYAFDKYLDENVIVARKPGTVAKADRKVYTVNQDLTSKASSASEILGHIPSWSGLLNADFSPVKHGTVQLNARYHSVTLVP